MKLAVSAFISGLIFSVGLGVAGMTRPEKIVGFLDFGGNWDPSLAFVMVGAIFVFAVGYRIVVRWQKPKLASAFQLPKAQPIDGKLVFGSVIFGVGWGLAGFCPGPGVVSLATLAPQPILFVTAMVLGMMAYRWVFRT